MLRRSLAAVAVCAAAVVVPMLSASAGAVTSSAYHVCPLSTNVQPANDCPPPIV